jgi:hypothetical protein
VILSILTAFLTASKATFLSVGPTHKLLFILSRKSGFVNEKRTSDANQRIAFKKTGSGRCMQQPEPEKVRINTSRRAA